jgi:hypothetical protein
MLGSRFCYRCLYKCAPLLWNRSTGLGIYVDVTLIMLH